MASRLPNIILLVLDTLSAKHMSLYGYNRFTTPNMERIASESSLYTRCYAPGCWTPPSHASLFTGLYPSLHGMDNPFNYLNSLHLCSVLKQSGYRTFAISNNDIVSLQTGILQDLDKFYHYKGLLNLGNMEIKARDPEMFSKMRDESNWASRRKIAKIKPLLQYTIKSHDFIFLLKRMFAKINDIKTVHHNSAPKTRRSFREALRIIKENRSSATNPPVFLFLNIMEAHSLYNPPPRFRKFSRPSDKDQFAYHNFYCPQYNNQIKNIMEMQTNLYDDEILFLDLEIGNFFDKLKEAGVLNDTILIITSDHGEHLGEKGHFDHRFSLYQEIIKIPLIIKFPQVIQSNGVYERLASLTDIFATLLDVIDNPYPRPRDSFSLFSTEPRSSISAMILNDNPLKDLLAKRLKKPKEWTQNIISHTYTMILDNNIKIIENDQGKIEIYNLQRDPFEEQNLTTTLDPAMVKELREILMQDKLQTQYIV